MTTDENPLGKVVAKALQDEAFKERLIADPAATFAAEGIELPDGVDVKVVEDTDTVRHLVLPAAQALSESELVGLAGGVPVRGCEMLDLFGGAPGGGGDSGGGRRG
jgi:hypothetical protein